MKRIMTILAIWSLSINVAKSVSAPASVDAFDLQDITDTTATIWADITLPDSGYYYVLRDYDSVMTNPKIIVPGTLLFGHNTTAHIVFTDDSLVPGVTYIYMIVAVCDYTVPMTRDSSFLAVNTAVPAQVNNLLGNFTQTSPIQLTVDYMAHSYATTIKYLRLSDSTIVAVHSGLLGSGIQTDTVSFAQAVNTIEGYVAIAWNVYNSNSADYDTSNSWTVSTMTPVVMQPPLVDSISTSFVTHNSLSAFFSWNSDSLPGTVYLYYLCNGALPGNIVTVFSVPPGVGDTTIQILFSCPDTSVHLMVILENAYGGFDRDTLIRAFTTPPPPPPASGAMIPYAVWIDSIAMTALIQVDSISVVSPSSFIQIEAIDVDTANNGAFALVIPIQGPVTNATVSNIFHGAPGHCYYLRAVLVDGNTITQTWYIQSTPVCFPGGFTAIEEHEQSGWQVGPDKLTPRDFPAVVTVIDIQGRVVIEAQEFQALSDVTNAIPMVHGLYIAYSIDKKTNITKVAKLFK